MADQEARELLRQLRERYAFNVVEAPPDELIETLRADARQLIMGKGLQAIAALTINWLAAIGRPALCARAKPEKYVNGRNYRRYSCTLPLGHDGNHERRTKARVLTWRADGQDMAIALYLKAVAADSKPPLPPRTEYPPLPG